MIKQFVLLTMLSLVAVTVIAQNPTLWRGENSEGKYEAPNLLDSWPETGPEVLWTFEELGKGYSSPVFANGKIYTTGMIDDDGVLFILNEQGKLEKKLTYGKEWNENYHGTRSSPTILEEVAYLYSGNGEVICMNLTDGKKVWSKSLADFDAENIRFGVTESLVVDGDLLYFTPGGPSFNIIAMNRFDGQTVWSTSAKEERSTYCTPKIIQLPNRKLLVTHTKSNIVGIDASNGKMLWNHAHSNRYEIHPNTPIFQDNALFCFSGYGTGCVRLDLNEDGSAITKAWSSESLDNQMGGAIIHEGYIYGSGHSNRGWFCLDWETGEEKYKSMEVANGVIIMAADKFIIYSDRGDLVLANPNPEKFDIISRTKVEHGSAQHWAHPIVYNEVLYLRHGNALIAYKISK